MSSNITINMNNVFKLGLSIEQYFVLECIYNKNKKLLESYANNCGKIDRSKLKELANLGYIEPINY